MDFNFSAFDESSLAMRISEGVYYFNDTPYYFIEHVEEELSEYVIVYDIHDREEKENPQKKYRIESYQRTIPGGTPLSNLIKSMMPQRKYPKKVVDDPIFVANIIPLGVDTITGKTGKGFFERDRDRTIYSQKEPTKVVHGQYTGVFIGLTNVKWNRTYTPLESVVEYCKRVKGDRLNV
ncbi:hypothetical protein [Staphylococcus phage vB_SsapH-Golestan-105-M]|nr:hypothetical protein [Staphylococcus phage vB_SsapH-Golestan-105-M]